MKIRDFAQFGLLIDKSDIYKELCSLLEKKKFTKISDDIYMLRNWTIKVGADDYVEVIHGSNGNGIGDVFDYKGAIDFIKHL